jgi:preprotein translocase subunit SecY
VSAQRPVPRQLSKLLAAASPECGSEGRHLWLLAQLKLQRPVSSATASSLVFLLLALVVYRIGAHIPVPGIDPAQLQQLFSGQQGGILNLFNMFSGGALSRFTVFALGIMPYISASIIMQLMTYVVPTFEQLKKEGEAGRRKITQYTRYGTLGWPFFSRWALLSRWKALQVWC